MTRFMVPHKCPSCGQRAVLELTDKQVEELEKWSDGGKKDFIQVALPSWSDAWRETLITGMDSECWDRLMGEDEY